MERFRRLGCRFSNERLPTCVHRLRMSVDRYAVCHACLRKAHHFGLAAALCVTYLTNGCQVSAPTKAYNSGPPKRLLASFLSLFVPPSFPVSSRTFFFPSSCLRPSLALPLPFLPFLYFPVLHYMSSVRDLNAQASPVGDCFAMLHIFVSPAECKMRKQHQQSMRL